MPKYEAVAHVRWELPFALRLPAKALFVWEPEEGTALFDPRPGVGDLAWKRKCSFLTDAELFDDLGPPNKCHAKHDYMVTSVLRSGKEIKTALLGGGAEGGFSEARPYTVANLFLCLRRRSDYSGRSLLERGDKALNNLIEVYRFLTLDPLVRPMRADRDCYYTLVSVADVAEPQRDIDARALLGEIGDLSFGSTIGVDRIHHVGLNSFDALLSGDMIEPEILGVLVSLVGAPHELEIFHQLMFSAIRRLKRNEHALAVLDAQSAFESLVAVIVVENLRNQGKRPEQIDEAMAVRGTMHTLQQRLQELDRVAGAQPPSGLTPRRFLGSSEENRWRNDLYRLRNRIVHEGLRSVSFAEAKAALVAGLYAISAIQELSPRFRRAMSWAGPVLELRHVQQSPGRLSRFFES